MAPVGIGQPSSTMIGRTPRGRKSRHRPSRARATTIGHDQSTGASS